MIFTEEQSKFIQDYSKSLKNHCASVFLGSGLSRQSGYVGWSDLLKKFVKQIGLKINKEQDLISLAQYYVNNKKDVFELKRYVCKVFDKNKKFNDNHFLLASLPLDSYWTTNYDLLLEQVLEYREIKYNKIVKDCDLRKNINSNPIWLYKMHGDVNDENSIVITKQDYENYYDDYEMLIAKLKSEICTKTFLFLGYSISDPNVMHILARARKVFDKNNGRKHYAIMQRPQKNIKNKKNKNYNYEIIKQQHQIVDLAEYGIEVILVDDYSEINEILKAIVNEVYKKNIFISGTLENDTKNMTEICSIANKLSSRLILSGYKIFTGYGKTLGAFVVDGAYSGCKLQSKDDFYHQTNSSEMSSVAERVTNKYNSRVFLFPFPYAESMSDEDRAEYYFRLRKNMLASTRVMIILCGEKGTDKRISDGVIAEYNLACEFNDIVIPLAISGGAALKIWEEINNKKESLKYSYERFENLKYGTFESAVDNIMGILEELC